MHMNRTARSLAARAERVFSGGACLATPQPGATLLDCCSAAGQRLGHCSSTASITASTSAPACFSQSAESSNCHSGARQRDQFFRALSGWPPYHQQKRSISLSAVHTAAQSGSNSRLEFGRSNDGQASLTGKGAATAGRASTEWEEEKRQQEDRKQLMEAALKHVKEKGWTLAAVQEGARDLHLSPAIAASLERGAAELVEHFVEKSNQEFSVVVAERKSELENMRLKERISVLVRWRLELTAPFIDSWPQAMCLQVLPSNMGTAARQLALLIDDMWHAAGDTATDYNWYTKRALLTGVYTTTELYMLTDYSPGLADTWEALDRRIGDVMRLGRFAGQMNQTVRQGADGLRSMAAWMQERMRAQQNPQRAP